MFEQGLKPSLLGTTVSQGIYFYLYSILRQAAVRYLQARGRGKNGEHPCHLFIPLFFTTWPEW